MVALPKISIGKKTKRSYFDLTHDVNTTSDFGFCQPTICREFYKDSKISLKTRQFVRLGAMPCPTFGRIEVKTHTAFVPVRDTFLAYDYLQAQKTVTSANRSYIPQCADYVTANTLFGSIIELILDKKNYENSSATTVSDLIDPTRFFGRFSVWMTWEQFINQSHEAYSQHAPNEYVDIVNDDVIIQYDDLVKNSVRVLMSLICNSVDNVENIQNSPFYNALRGPAFFGRGDVGILNTKTGVQYLQQTEPEFFMFGTYKANRKADVIFDHYDVNTVGYRFVNSYGYLNSLIYKSVPDFLVPMSFDKPDFQLGWFNTPYETVWEDSRPQAQVIVNLHLTRSGRRLFKVLTGCRISFGTKRKKIDLMRLLSYYKVWFDKYNPGRNLQWLDTNAFGLIHSYYDYGSVLDNIINGLGADYARIPVDTRPRYKAFWFNFLADLPNCCYVLPIDNMTCATPTPLLEISENSQSINSIGIYSSNTNPSSTSDAYVTDNTIYGYDRGHTLELSGGLGLQLLNRIYHLVNKNSVIGSKIDEYLRAHNISRGLPKSNVLGDSKFMCAIDDVFSTSGTDEALLGEYAGKGIGNGSSDSMHFETDSFGYLIQIMCVVPLGGYVQGMRDCPINRFDFYQPEFDSLGMEPMSYSNFINRRYDYLTFDNEDTVFGFRPRYFGLKIENNLANGGFAFQSQQTQFLPYCLDRIFDLKSDVDLTEDYVADEELRYIGRYEKFGNYDRIFYDTTGITDNFIVHMIQEFGMYAPMKSISDSYDTFDKDVDDADINVQKA